MLVKIGKIGNKGETGKGIYTWYLLNICLQRTSNYTGDPDLFQLYDSEAKLLQDSNEKNLWSIITDSWDTQNSFKTFIQENFNLDNSLTNFRVFITDSEGNLLSKKFLDEYGYTYIDLRHQPNTLTLDIIGPNGYNKQFIVDTIQNNCIIAFIEDGED